MIGRWTLVARLVGACAVLAALASPAQAQSLSGPPGVSSEKVLVIGIDGIRWDSLQRAIAAGRAPNIAQLGSGGFAMPTLLEYAPPEAATLSEVGWSTIATGVWPAKHGVNGMFLNNDPRQATKNGYHDFLTRIEQLRPSLSTFLVSCWANIGRHEKGGPIFSDAIDAKHSTAAADTIESYDRGDRESTDLATRYLREGSPDAGFVYLGLVDEAAHAEGSATRAYADAIEVTDGRVGELVAAIRAREAAGRERWVIVITTDHGQQDLPFGSVASHGFGSNLEVTSLLIANGPGVPRDPRPGSFRVVDVAPTVLHRLGLAVDPAWRLDGRPFITAVPARQPAAAGPSASARLRRLATSPVLEVRVAAATDAALLRTLEVTLPAGMRIARGRGTLRGRADGRRLRGRRLRTRRDGRITVPAPAPGARSITVVARAGALRISRSLRGRLRRGRRATVRVVATEASGRRTPLAVRLTVR